MTIRTIEELDIVSNQNLCIEMFLVRLMYLSSSKEQSLENNKLNEPTSEKIISADLKNETINQIKNISQEKKIKSEVQPEVKVDEKFSIKSFDQLLEICSKNKEIKLKYELEKNVNLVSFEQNRIEISFNDNLDKNFVKDISSKLFDWTGQRWIISFSKVKGEISIKDKEKKQKNELLIEAKDSKLYKSVLERFPDAKLVDLTSKTENKD